MFKLFTDLFSLLSSIVASLTNCSRVAEVHTDVWNKRTVLEKSQILIDYEAKIREIDAAQGK